MVSEKNDSENFLAKKIDNPLNEREKNILPIINHANTKKIDIALHRKDVL
jgi:DNA-directed RNA polymerase specialized sigma subunit